MTKSRIFLAGGMLAMMAVIALVFGMTAGYGGAAAGSQSGADEAAVKAISDADLQRMRGRGEAMLARLHVGDASPDGIKVHGAWTLDIRNPDGTLAKHVEFQNALELTGADYLASLLAGDSSLGTWFITVVTDPPICGPDETPASCILSSDVVDELNLEVIVDGGADIFRLSGEIIANRDGKVLQVGTTQLNGGVFTSKTLAVEDQEDVVEGQQILVKVDITFN